jgi:hypothetical protein
MGGHRSDRSRASSPEAGATVRDPDGTHLTPDGSKVVWRWLAGQLRNGGLLRTR